MTLRLYCTIIINCSLCTTSHHHHHSFTHQSSCILSSSTSSVYKELICITVESPQRTNHDFFCELLRHLSTPSSSPTPDDAMMMVLSASDLQSAVYKFLAVLDDLIIDAPLAVSCTVVLSCLMIDDDPSLTLPTSLPLSGQQRSICSSRSGGQASVVSAAILYTSR